MNLFCLLIEPVAPILGHIFHHVILDLGAYLFLNELSSSGLSKEIGECEDRIYGFSFPFFSVVAPRRHMQGEASEIPLSVKYREPKHQAPKCQHPPPRQSLHLPHVFRK